MVVWSAFEMRAHQEVDVFDGDGALWRSTMECRRNPAYSVRTAGQSSLGFGWRCGMYQARGSVIDGSFAVARTENGSQLKWLRLKAAAADDAIGAFLLAGRNRWTGRIDRTVEMVCGHEFAQIRTAHEFALVAEGVVEVEITSTAELVRMVTRGRRYGGRSMVAAYRLDAPDFAHVGDDDAVRLWVPVCRWDRKSARNACSRSVRQQDRRDDIFLADAAGNFRRPGGIGKAAARPAGRPQYVRWRWFRGAHRRIVFVDTCLGEDTAVQRHIDFDTVSA